MKTFDVDPGSNGAAPFTVEAASQDQAALQAVRSFGWGILSLTACKVESPDTYQGFYISGCAYVRTGAEFSVRER